MSLKDLFVQKSDDTPEIPTVLRDMAKTRRAPAPTEDVPVTDFDTTGLDTSAIVSIADIYAKEGIGDLSRSIFKVEEIKAVVPAELPTESKKKTVLGMLGVSGLDVPSLTTDAELRVSTLKAAQQALDDKANNSVASDEAQISEYEAKIDALKQNINQTKKTQEAQNVEINAEVTRIDDIMKFIG